MPDPPYAHRVTQKWHPEHIRVTVQLAKSSLAHSPDSAATPRSFLVSMINTTVGWLLHIWEHAVLSNHVRALMLKGLSEILNEVHAATDAFSGVTALQCQNICDCILLFSHLAEKASVYKKIKRQTKSCCLQWISYPRPDLKRGVLLLQ